MGESRAAEAVTVAWMLTTIATIGAQALAVLVWAILAVVARGHDIQVEIALLPALLFYIAVITGVVGLLLTVVAHKARKTLPPRSVTVFAVVVGLMPLATILLLAVLRRG